MKNPLAVVLLVLIFCSAGCETFKSKRKSEVPEIPVDGLLGAKVTTLEFAMDNMAEEDRRYTDAEYAAFGIVDSDPLHQKALVALLKGRVPPVVDADKLYSRSSNSQWYEGQPALKWTASAAKSPDHPNQAKVVVGWMNSTIINEFVTYVVEFDGSTWSVIDVELAPEASEELAR